MELTMRAAKAAYNRAYYTEHRAEIRAQQARYRAAHHDAILAQKRAYNAARPGGTARGVDVLTIVVDLESFVWTPAQVLTALRRWTRRHGRTPRYADLNRHQPPGAGHLEQPGSPQMHRQLDEQGKLVESWPAS